MKSLAIRLLIASCLYGPLALSDTQMKVATDKGYVAFVVEDGWAVISMKTGDPVSAIVYQLPNPADAGTPESTNLVLMLYDLVTPEGRSAYDEPLPQYGDEAPAGTAHDGWTVYRQLGIQNEVEYTVLDAKRKGLADMAASVRLAWPHLPGNSADYDSKMETTFKAFLASVQGHTGRFEPGKDVVIHRPIE